MEGTSKYARAVLAALAAFVLFCAGAFFNQSSWRGPWKVTSEYRPVSEGAADTSLSEEKSRPDSLLPGEVIDVNTADIYDLQRLPGIGEKRAQDIVAWREEHGPFQTLDELTQVSGIGPGILEGLREYAAAGNEVR